jgi:hypothetical protein
MRSLKPLRKKSHPQCTSKHQRQFLLGVFIANEELTSTVIIGTALVMFGSMAFRSRKRFGG